MTKTNFLVKIVVNSQSSLTTLSSKSPWVTKNRKTYNPKLDDPWLSQVGAESDISAEVITTGQPASNTKAFPDSRLRDSRLSREWRFKHKSERVPEKAGQNHWSHVTHNWFLWGRVLSTEPKAHGNTLELTDQLILACSHEPLAQWIGHALTKIRCQSCFQTKAV